MSTERPQWRCLEPGCVLDGQWQVADDAPSAWVEHYRNAHSADRLVVAVDVSVDVRRAP